MKYLITAIILAVLFSCQPKPTYHSQEYVIDLGMVRKDSVQYNLKGFIQKDKGLTGDGYTHTNRFHMRYLLVRGEEVILFSSSVDLDKFLME